MNLICSHINIVKSIYIHTWSRIMLSASLWVLQRSCRSTTEPTADSLEGPLISRGTRSAPVIMSLRCVNSSFLLMASSTTNWITWHLFSITPRRTFWEGSGCDWVNLNIFVAVFSCWGTWNIHFKFKVTIYFYKCFERLVTTNNLLLLVINSIGKFKSYNIFL